MEYSNQLNKFCLLFFPLIIIFLISGSFLINFYLAVFSFFMIYLIKSKKFEIQKKILIPLIILYLYLNLNTLLSVDFYNSLTRNFFYFRFILLTFATIFILENFYKNLLNLSRFWLIVLSVLSFDIMFQGYFGFNIVGYQTSSPMRNSSFFFSELKAASIINGLGFLSLIIFYNFSKKKYIIILIFITFLIAVFVTGERSNFIKFIIISIPFIFLLMNREKLKVKVFGVLSLIIISTFVLVFTDNNIFKRFKTSTIINSDKTENIIQIYKYSHWGSHAFTAIEILRSNKFFGVGNKNFRIECKNYQEIIVKKYGVSPKGCSTHPHQFYYELISEHGLVGSLIIIGTIFYLIILRFKKPLNKINCIALVYLLINFIPFLPSGSFFTTYDATLFWLNMAFFLYIPNPEKINKI